MRSGGKSTEGTITGVIKGERGLKGGGSGVQIES